MRDEEISEQSMQVIGVIGEIFDKPELRMFFHRHRRLSLGIIARRIRWINADRPADETLSQSADELALTGHEKSADLVRFVAKHARQHNRSRNLPGQESRLTDAEQVTAFRMLEAIALMWFLEASRTTPIFRPNH